MGICGFLDFDYFCGRFCNVTPTIVEGSQSMISEEEIFLVSPFVSFPYENRNIHLPCAFIPFQRQNNGSIII